MDTKNENINIDPRELATRRARYVHERINKYSDLGPSTKDTRKCLRERAVTCSKLGCDDLAELYECKGDQFFEFVNSFDREATKVFKELRGGRPKGS